jgi:type IV pilus assembly protein PilC
LTVQSTFSYRARTSAGEVVTGSMTAESAQEVSARLRSEGKYVLNIDDKPLRAETELNADQIRRNEAAKRCRREDVIAFCQQLAVMLETGVPLSEALDAFYRQMPRREFRAVLAVLRDDVCSGDTFSTALARWPRVFPRLMISLMKASEASGTMAMMLARIGEYLHKERRTLKQIKGAMSYPMFMMGAGVLLSMFLMVFILPRFAKIYERRSAALPTPTRVLLEVSSFLTEQWLYYVPALGLLTIGWLIFVRQPMGVRTCDWMRLNLPILRTMFRQLYITRAARTMSTLVSAGVSVLDIISICRGITNNVCFNVLWDQMEEGVRGGQQISDAVTQSPYIPPNVASMIASGERSGRLGEVMERVAEFSEQELEGAVKQVTGYVEPVMIICMGVVVGGVAIALLLPIFKMGNVMAGG